MKSYDTTLTRLILILTKLSNNEKPTTKELSEEFGIGIRTIQRDIYQRLVYFPIEKDSEDRLKFIDGFSLDRSTLDNDEMMLVYLSLSQLKGLSNKFEDKIDTIISKLLLPNYTTPFHIKTTSFEKLEVDSKIVKDINKAIFYFQEASKNNHADAAFALGMIYHRGKDIPKDDETAKDYFDLAIVNGNLEVKKIMKLFEDNQVPVTLKDGIELFKNEEFLKALDVFKILAKKNNTDALFYIAYICEYYDFEGKPDNIEPFELFLISAQNNLFCLICQYSVCLRRNQSKG